MAEQNCFKFTCPHCGQHLEAESDMGGMVIDCPICGQLLKVPFSGNAPFKRVVPNAKTYLYESSHSSGRWKKWLKVIGIGIALLCLFVGVGIIGQSVNYGGNTAWGNKKVLTSAKCLLDFLEMPNERRLRVLSNSLEVCPSDFKDTVCEYLVSVLKNPEDFISPREQEDAMKTKAGAAILFGLLGVAITDDSRGGVNAGLELGDMAYAELKRKAMRKLQQEIEMSRNRLIGVAQKYGINPNAFEEELVSRER